MMTVCTCHDFLRNLIPSLLILFFSTPSCWSCQSREPDVICAQSALWFLRHTHLNQVGNSFCSLSKTFILSNCTDRITKLFSRCFGFIENCWDCSFCNWDCAMPHLITVIVSQPWQINWTKGLWHQISEMWEACTLVSISKIIRGAFRVVTTGCGCSSTSAAAPCRLSHDAASGWWRARRCCSAWRPLYSPASTWFSPSTAWIFATSPERVDTKGDQPNRSKQKSCWVCVWERGAVPEMSFSCLYRKHKRNRK